MNCLSVYVKANRFCHLCGGFDRSQSKERVGAKATIYVVCSGLVEWLSVTKKACDDDLHKSLAA